MKPKKKSKKSPKKKKLSEKSILSVSTPSSSKKVKDSQESESDVPRLIKKRKLYAKEALQAAYKAVKDSSISVNAAAKQYGVPLTTLRDRVDGRISIHTTRPGPPLLLAKDEEAEIVQFLHTMARYGYRYTRLELGEIATDQAVEKGKKNPRANGLTTKWVDNFIGRWPSIRELSCKFKNKADAEHTVRTYFDEIKNIIDKHRLLDKTDRIFNIMEIGLVTEHGISNHSARSGHSIDTVSYTSMIACGSVSGKVMAPFFIYQALRLRPEMMRGLPDNVNAAVSETGKCTPQIFRRYLNEHFLPQTQRTRDSEPILVLMDGSRSHVFVSLAEWGRSNNVIFSFIPAHTTHLLQPLEVECAEKVQQKYENICRKYLKNYSGPFINRNSVGELACNAYLRVITRHSLVHSFRKAGVYPDISSEESEEEVEDTFQDDSYHPSFYKAEDNVDDFRDEVVYTGDLVVGHNEEITEEEVVTTQEMILIDNDVDIATSTDIQEPEAVEEDMLCGQELMEHQQPPRAEEEEELVVTPEGQVLLNQGGQMVLAPSGHIVIQGGDIFVKNSEGTFTRLQQVQVAQPGGKESVPSVEEGLAKTNSDLCKISPLKQCVTSDGKTLDSVALNVLNDSAFNPVDQSTISSENLRLMISPISGSEEQKLSGRYFHRSPSNNSSTSSNNSMFVSMEDSALGLKHNDSSLELSSSFSVNGESSRGSISPGIHKVIVKKEGEAGKSVDKL